MHLSQQKILQLAREQSISGRSLREIGSLVGIPHPHTVRFHILKLVDKGFLDAGWNLKKSSENLIHIPVYGTANCGVATHIADNSVESYLPVSKGMLGGSYPNGIFALRASGKSMNRATPNINDGDYVLIKPVKDVDILDGDNVVSLFGDHANIKRINIKPETDVVLFLSVSTEEFPPIAVTKSEYDEGIVKIIGKVFRVIPSH